MVDKKILADKPVIGHFQAYKSGSYCTLLALTMTSKTLARCLCEISFGEDGAKKGQACIIHVNLCAWYNVDELAWCCIMSDFNQLDYISFSFQIAPYGKMFLKFFKS